jgi:hypothetical protein
LYCFKRNQTVTKIIEKLYNANFPGINYAGMQSLAPAIFLTGIFRKLPGIDDLGGLNQIEDRICGWEIPES